MSSFLNTIGFIILFYMISFIGIQQINTQNQLYLCATLVLTECSIPEFKQARQKLIRKQRLSNYGNKITLTEEP